MRLYNTPHHFSCGIALPARHMDRCILSQDGERLGPRTMPAAPAPGLNARAPSRDGLVVAGEESFPGYGLADLGAHAQRPFVLGHALAMHALHGGQAKTDQLDAPKIATLLRGGLLPHAAGSPAERRAPRALLRRRPPCGASGLHF
jgi:hypothetical protein